LTENLTENLSVGFDLCAQHMLKHIAFVSFQQGDGHWERPPDKFYARDDGNRVSEQYCFLP
jgi:hypothetical protein